VSSIVCLLFLFTITACARTPNDNGDNDNAFPNTPTDTEAPTILPESMPSTLTLGGRLTVAFTVSDNESSAEDIYTDVIILNAAEKNVTAQTYDKATRVFTPTQTGMHSIIIEAYDKAGNCGTLTHSVNVKSGTGTTDTQKPVISLGNMATRLALGGYITVNYTVQDNVSAPSNIQTEVKILTETDADVTRDVYGNGRFTPAQAGVYRIVIRAVDEAGNEQTATHTVTVTDGTEEATMPTNPYFPADQAWGQDASVHDPSVFYDPVGKMYYAYGSHFAVARSSDLVKWTYVSDTDTAIYGAPRTQVLTKAYAYVGGDINTWAPDVEYYNGKYYMYFSITSAFGSRKSVIGRVESTSPTGPFNQNEALLVQSGGNSGPNAIDPELFYDKDGRLWMVYGSFFEGIFIIELNNSGANWGMPKESGYGKKIWQGGSNGPEGPFIFYNAETDYYYLITSYGELSHNYNMNVARSKNPDGPYVDAAGSDMAAVQGGNKLAGNYKFNGASTYAALGHNSVIKTADNKYINVFHTRYALGTAANPGAHNLRSHQLFFNEDGWPVMSPARYAGETTGRVTAAKAAGNYDVIIHSASKSADDIVNSVAYTLAAGGEIKSGSNTAGSWQMSGNYYITLTLNGTTYKGVIVPT
ncbi:MAG: glycoside hydrolase family 43 protein, partial [Clostridiales bacterium]|nr:glycoside hydrolase family 43 protein [Clostridiales bacterium]